MGSKITIIILIIISLGVRFYRLGESPASVNWDEAALGYNAYSMLLTGRDEFGKPFPMALQSFDDYKPALYSYFSVLPIKILGLGDVSTRATSAIFGVLWVLTLTIITIKLSGKWMTGVLAGILMAFEPWAMHFSRIAFEANLGGSLMWLGVALAISSRMQTAAVIMGVLSMYGYHSQRIIALPVIFTILWLKNRKTNKISGWIKLILVTGVMLSPLFYNFMTEPITSRFSSTNIFKIAPFVPTGWPKYYSETYTFFWHAAGRYLAYFSPANLFLRGSNEPILTIPTQGLLHAADFLPAAAGGLVFLANPGTLSLLIPVMVLAPIPAVITWNWFSVVRTLAIYPIFTILTVLGLRRKKWVTILFILVWIPSIVYAFANETVYSPVINYGDFQPGFEESVPQVLTAANNYESVVVDSPQSAPYIFYLFYGKLDPTEYRTGLTDKHTNAGTEKGYRMGKFTFRNIYFPEDRLKTNQLTVGTAVSITDNTPNTKDYYDPAGYVSVRVFEPVNQRP